MKNLIRFKEFLIINFGLFLVALAIHFIMVPNNFVVGGVSGLAIVLHSFIPLSIGTLMTILNTILFILGMLLIGFGYGIRTLYSSYMLSFMVIVLERFFPIDGPLIPEGGHLFVQLTLLSIVTAIGLAIVFKYNASTGGTDITGKIINKYFHVDLGKAVLISDLFITLAALYIYDFKTFAYGLIGVIMNGLVIDFVLDTIKEQREITIISEKSDEISKFIIEVLEKGATIYPGIGAYTKQERDIIITIVNKKEFYKLKEYIKLIDLNAFITVNDIRETFGEGFTALSD
ncbi:MAG: transporter [Haloplasmataceae bacterium]|jgi:uncharacterized membrane-anchored protein YitT (DUF2179 family)|nr:transporter [Haloplasmataceae bacterium]